MPRQAIFAMGAGLLLACITTPRTWADSISTPSPVIAEHFDHLENWEPLEFPLQTNSSYQLTGDGMLCAQANNSVSAIVLTEKFKPAETPLLSWRWNVGNTFTKGNAEHEDGDDFPLRVSVCFKFDPKKVSDNERRWFKMQKLVWGEYPPYRVIHYVFANRSDLASQTLPCPYSDRARIIVKRSGASDTGQWHEEKVNIMEDFRNAFDEEPPKEAVISIMADGDNTEESSTAYLDWIEISR